MSQAVAQEGDAVPRGASVVVVGGGVTGLSAAWWLARQGVSVLVIEKGIVGWEASGRNGGGCSHHFSPLFAEEQRLWPMMDELLGYPTEFQAKRGRLAFSEAQVALYGRALVNGARAGFDTDVLDPKQARDMCPLAGDNVVGGYFYRFGGHANPHRTVQAYAWALQDLGGQILQHTTVLGFERSGERVTGVRTSRGTFGCDHLVLAAGPQGARLATKLGAAVPMVQARAEMIVTEPIPLMTVTAVDGNGLYGRQTLRGNLAYGGGPHEWLDEFEDGVTPSPASTPLMRNIAARLAEMFPKAAHVRVIRSWAGVIENTPDGRPVIDTVPGAPNVLFATMSGIGFGLSPAVGHVIQQIVMQGHCDFADVSTLRLSRFAHLEENWRDLQGWHGVTREATLAGA